MADSSTTSLELLKRGIASGEYVKIPDVPMFDVHDEYDTRRYLRDPQTKEAKPNPNFGKLIRRFDAARLQAIVDKNTKRMNDSGDVAPFGPGHTIPDPNVPETLQPPVWGYAVPERVGSFGPSGHKVGILGSLYARAEFADKVKRDFPRRSIELIPGEEFIDWVAILRRSPQRDLGNLSYSRDSVFYTAAQARFCPWETPDAFRPYSDATGQHALTAAIGADGKLRYSLDNTEEDPMPDLPNMPPPGAGAPGAPDMGQLPPEEQKKADMYWKYMRDSKPELKKMCDQYAAENPAGGAGGTPPGFPGANNMAPPGGGPPVGLPDDDKLRMQRETMDGRVARLEAELQASRAREQEAAKAARYARAEQRLRGLGNLHMDLPTEVEMLYSMPDEKWANRLDYMAHHYQRTDSPIGTPNTWITVPGSPGDDTNPDSAKNVEHRRIATRYMRERPGCTFEQAMAATTPAN